MFGMGFQEMVMILVVALIVIGPKRLPELARTLGKGLAEFRRATDDFRRSVADDEAVQTIRKTQDEIRRTTADLKRKALAVPGPKDLVP
ncbi:MAG: Sec-independent protein translocase protein TatB, partial [Candidatus Methylomirabilis sp.]|nr:Sec-independent protein translocase protein TatB [Deltaproteobacteria bacterium]